MRTILSQLSLFFSAGAVGGLTNAFAVNMYMKMTSHSFLGIKINQGLATEMIYERIVLGGIWGVILIIPVPFKNFIMRGLLYSLAPSLIQLLVILPVQKQGLLGLAQGAVTPLQVLLFNAVWGIVTVFWFKAIEK